MELTDATSVGCRLTCFIIGKNMDEVIRIIDTYSISFGTRYVGTSYSFIFLFLLAFMHHFPKNSKNSGFKLNRFYLVACCRIP